MKEMLSHALSGTRGNMFGSVAGSIGNVNVANGAMMSGGISSGVETAEGAGSVSGQSVRKTSLTNAKSAMPAPARRQSIAASP